MTDPAALLLDLDGTLLDTAPDMGGALNRLRVEHGLEPLPAETIRPVVSHGAMRLVSLGFPEARGTMFETLRLRFLELYAANLVVGTRLFPGFDRVLERLEGGGLPWGIVTNKPAWLTDPLLATLGLDRRVMLADLVLTPALIHWLRPWKGAGNAPAAPGVFPGGPDGDGSDRADS